MTSPVACLLSLTQAHPCTLLLYLVFGVRKVVLQVAPQSVCSAFGVELMEKPVEWRARSVCR